MHVFAREKKAILYNWLPFQIQAVMWLKSLELMFAFGIRICTVFVCTCVHTEHPVSAYLPVSVCVPPPLHPCDWSGGHSLWAV